MTNESSSANTVFEAWITEARAASSTQKNLPTNGGYFELAQTLLRPSESKWTIERLRTAESRAVLPYTHATPDIRREYYKPTPSTNGTRGQGSSYGYYWCLNDDGDYYISRFLLEDIREGVFPQASPGKSLDFNLAVIRIAELLLLSADLYRALGIRPDEPYLLAIGYGGLKERDIHIYDVPVSSLPVKVTPSSQSQIDTFKEEHEVTQDKVAAELKELTCQTVNSLTKLFGVDTISEERVSTTMDLLGVAMLNPD